MSARQGTPRLVTTDLQAVDDSRCTVLHVDMDAFFAMVEIRRRPELRGRPMMVAGGDGRGVVLSATYEARRHGVRSAMPTGTAQALCPGILIVPPDHTAYSEASASVMALFRDITPLVEPVSVDEAFLDVSGLSRTLGRPGAVAAHLRTRIRTELGLPATVGAASSKFMAKLASGLAKPDGLLVVPPAEVLSVLHPLPIRALWGVGPATAATLEAIGASTIGALATTDRALLVRTVGEAVGAKLHDLSWGRDDRVVTTESSEASLGAENTFAQDTRDRVVLDRELLQLADRTGRRARAGGIRGRTVALKIRFDDFTTISRSLTLSTPTDHTPTVYDTARALLDRVPLAGRRIRLLGVRLEGLVRADQVVEQLAFAFDDAPSDGGPDTRKEFSDTPRGSGSRPSRSTAVGSMPDPAAHPRSAPPAPPRRAAPDRVAAEGATDLVRARFGAAALGPATLLGPAVKRRRGPHAPSTGPSVHPDRAPQEDEI
ncbi:DNA polymerase IV [Nakamurella flavida]|uniref:DNA polymerase IV n=1 Tax=Nakamurella flavida TaxID=363630 RepID=A0A938YN54_9ACTN|nr:DNA polymerase IV [Nakamurella flavida]MBM9478344.1 DNA polymerase IV [Nakamurella flavida]MDP9777484.1 DNA polymerase-4 [Nakamurella flavida]